MPTPRDSLAADSIAFYDNGALVKEILYAVGGSNNSGYLSTNLAFTDRSPITVQIDVEPGVFPNSIDLSTNGILPVAILTTAGFNAANVAPKTVEFTGAPGVQSMLKDVDNDGDIDLLVGFSIKRPGFSCASTTATLIGATKADVPFADTDSVLITRNRKGQLCH